MNAKNILAYLIVGVLVAGMYSAGFREHNSQYPRGYQIVTALIGWPLLALIVTGQELIGGETFYEEKKE